MAKGRLSGKPRVPSRRRRNFGGFLLTGLGLGLLYLRIFPGDVATVTPAVGLILIIGGCLCVTAGFLLMASAAPGLLELNDDLHEHDFESPDRSQLAIRQSPGKTGHRVEQSR